MVKNSISGRMFMIALLFSLFFLVSYQDLKAAPFIQELDTAAERALDPHISDSLLKIKKAVMEAEEASFQKTFTQEQADAAYTLIDKTLAQIVLAKGKKSFRGEKKSEDSESSSESDSSCDRCVFLIHEVRKFFDCICRELKGKLESIEEFLEEKFPCNNPVPISSVPFVITEPGRYCVVNDLFYPGTGPAITILSDNVLIDFEGHVLTIGTASSQGIFGQHLSNIFIKNGTIQSEAPSTNYENRAIFLLQSSHGVVTDMKILNTFYGIHLGDYDLVTFTGQLGVIDFRILGCYFNLPSGASTQPAPQAGRTPAAIRAANSQAISVDSTVFGQLGIGTTVIGVGFFAQTNCKDTTITNCQFLNSNNSAAQCIFIQGQLNRPNEQTSEGTQVRNCSFFNSSFDFGFAQFNGGIVNALVQNCVSANAQNAFNFTGRGLTVENYVVNQKVAPNAFQLVLLGQSTQVIPGAISNPNPFPAIDVIFKNCDFVATQQVATGALINIQRADGVLIDGCVIDSNGLGDPTRTFPSCQIAVGRRVNNAFNVKIVNSVLRGNAQFGIFAATTSTTANNHIVVENCLIDGAKEAGIFIDNTQSMDVINCSIKNVTGSANLLGHGIHLTRTSLFCTVIDNSIANNFGAGILAEATATGFHFITDNKIFGNNVGIDNQGSGATQFYENQVCGNTTVDCVGLLSGLVGTPGSTTYQLGQNLCCSVLE